MLGYPTLSPFHLLVISTQRHELRGAQKKKEKRKKAAECRVEEVESKGKSRFYCILVHPALMRPPSLSAHLSPAGLAAQGPSVSVCVRLLASVCERVCVCAQRRDVPGMKRLSLRPLQTMFSSTCGAGSWDSSFFSLFLWTFILQFLVVQFLNGGRR